MIYIFCGDDYSAIKAKYDLLLKTQNLRSVGFEKVSEVITHLFQNALVAQDRAFVVRYDKDFLAAGEEAWQNVLETTQDTDLILIYQELDKRSKFYKFFSNYILEFSLEEENFVFSFSSAICARNMKGAAVIADNIEGKDAIGALSLVYNKLRKILQIQTTPKTVKIEVNTGLRYYDYHYNKKYCNIYSDDDLIYLLCFIDRIIERIKAGEIEADYALQYLIINLA